MTLPMDAYNLTKHIPDSKMQVPAEKRGTSSPTFRKGCAVLAILFLVLVAYGYYIWSEIMKLL